jgi:hypothetical protein
MAKAGAIAAALWILGTGGRLAFQLYATHGGGAAVARFSVARAVTGVNAWTSALILMALCEAVGRTSILAWRSMVIRRDAPTTPGVDPVDSHATRGRISKVHNGNR